MTDKDYVWQLVIWSILKTAMQQNIWDNCCGILYLPQFSHDPKAYSVPTNVISSDYTASPTSLFYQKKQQAVLHTGNTLYIIGHSNGTRGPLK